MVFEITGTQAGLDHATELTKERGRLVIAGYHQDGNRTVNLQLWNWRGIDVINAHERDRSVKVQGVQEAVHKWLAGELRIAPLITHQLPLSEINAAFKLADTRPPGFTKAIIQGSDRSGQTKPATSPASFRPGQVASQAAWRRLGWRS